MSKRRELKDRLTTLGEIKNIMGAMKNLALLEIRKLDVFLSTQQRVVNSIEAASQDFLSFYSNLQAESTHLQQLWIVIGSERGFCGDFNKALLQFVQTQVTQNNMLLLVIGNKLHTKLQDDPRVVAYITGHSVAEEIHVTLIHLTEALNQLRQQLKLEQIGRICAIYHDYEKRTVRLRQLLPLAVPDIKSNFAYPPLLNLEPAQYLTQLTDQYLYAALHEVFYTSLMVENHMRLEHMENAIHRLEKNDAQLRLHYNRVRQEEIIEEIEIILLSAEALSNSEESFFRL
ncbi:F-type H+-transporting ATPase subunit gamma [Nitrosomonas aestuarii]|uniref:F-type H+-transporting ATPase subunit gamma n=1 Tax=Nitrosomonas aestuarii TaxID=52441 RepID=A0A1I4CZX1_9PROT|nr:FoF1 ATP synthase subunit gamma [Nitrosomonas aestuarii]SFK86455.1 F-type H+-transporting ATPase subunit gamma [Nitrosomonas aestuarii]